MGKRSRTSSENTESIHLIRHAFELAEDLGISKLLVQASSLADLREVSKLRGTADVIWITTPGEDLKRKRGPREQAVQVPETHMARMSQIKMSIFLAVINNYIALDESVICLSGVAGSRRVDTLAIMNPGRDFPWLKSLEKDLKEKKIPTKVFEAVVSLALRFSAEGREGKAVGTIFVIGDPQQLLPYTRQLVLNPFEGHPEKSRNIFREDPTESLREFTALDGAIIIDTRAVVHSAGTYLDAPTGKFRLKSGLGARHAAAAAISAHTDAIAVTISESSGTVTVFHEGEVILELEKPDVEVRRRKLE